MTMDEIVEQVSFMLGLPASENVENLDPRKAVLIAFRELKRYMRTPTFKTVPYSTRLDLEKLGIVTNKILNIFAAAPRLGLTLSSIDSGNVFQVAASVKAYGTSGSAGNLEPIISEMAMAQVRNTLSTDFHWTHDVANNVVYCTHRDPIPAMVTIKYVPEFTDVSEVKDPTWVDYLLRLSEANLKKALGRVRSKYSIDGSNVSLDGESLLSEANAELEIIRQELETTHRNKLVMLT